MLHQFLSFNLRNKLGEGDGGVVWKAVRKDDALVCAVKILRAPLGEVTNAAGVPKEAQVMENLSEPGHPNLVKYYGWGRMYRDELIMAKKEHYCCFEANVGIFIVMEFVDGVVLEQKIGERSFGKSKRRNVFKQLVEAVHYMNTRSVSHGSLFLNNLMITKPNSTCSIPKLVVFDFGSAHNVSLGNGKGETRLDKDRRQCGGVLLALFSSANLNSQTITNKLMQKEALELARDFIDVRQPLTLEAALQTPFLTNGTYEKVSAPSITLWNDEIVENIASHIIQTGEVNDFANASLVCKQFFTVFQHSFLCTPQFPHLIKPMCSYYDLAVDAKIDTACMWLERLKYKQDWSILQEFSDKDYDFERELLESYFESVVSHIVEVRAVVSDFSEGNQPWNNLIVHFHDICGSSNYVGQTHTHKLAGYARERARCLSKVTPALINFQAEQQLYLRIIETIRELMISFDKEAKSYIYKHGLTLHTAAGVLVQ